MFRSGQGAFLLYFSVWGLDSSFLLGWKRWSEATDRNGIPWEKGFAVVQ